MAPSLHPPWLRCVRTITWLPRYAFHGSAASARYMAPSRRHPWLRCVRTMRVKRYVVTMPRMLRDLPVVLVHGLASSFEHGWRTPGWIDLLADAERTVIPVDILGHGTAAAPHDPPRTPTSNNRSRTCSPTSPSTRSASRSAPNSCCGSRPGQPRTLRPARRDRCRREPVPQDDEPAQLAAPSSRATNPRTSRPACSCSWPRAPATTRSRWPRACAATTSRSPPTSSAG